MIIFGRFNAFKRTKTPRLKRHLFNAKT